MATYRIKEYDYGTQKDYCVQRKSIFGFWYNPDNIDGYTTGFYDTLDDARKVLKMKITKTKTRIVDNEEALAKN